MNKKNSGFSLVELIVVIAIMAVLVGVLAPAYLKYVEKSRKSADLDSIDVLVKAVDTIVSDEEYEDAISGVTEFKISNSANSKDVKLDATGQTGTNATDAWKEIANVKSFNLKSKSGNKGSFDLKGKVNNNGSVTWTLTYSGGLFAEKEASNFKNKISA